MKAVRGKALAVGLSLFVFAPGSSFAAGAAPVRKSVTIFAASSLTRVFEAMKAPFEAAHPELALRFSFGSSSLLRSEIEHGAAADAIAVADPAELAPLVRSKTLVDPRDFAEGRLVAAVSSGGGRRIHSLLDLAAPGAVLVAASPNVPLGRYTRETLGLLSRMEGFPPDFQALFERNVVSLEIDARAVLSKVELGEADAAFVYESDAAGSTRVTAIALPAGSAVVARYAMGRIAQSNVSAGARSFVDFVLSDDGAAILKRFGFRPVPGERRGAPPLAPVR